MCFTCETNSGKSISYHLLRTSLEVKRDAVVEDWGMDGYSRRKRKGIHMLLYFIYIYILLKLKINLGGPPRPGTAHHRKNRAWAVDLVNGLAQHKIF